MLKILENTLTQVKEKHEDRYYKVFYTVNKEDRTYKCIRRSQLSKYSSITESVVAIANTQKELANELDRFYL